MFSMPLWNNFQLLQILNNLSIRHLIKLVLYENDVKLLKSKRSPGKVEWEWEKWEILIIDNWNGYIKKSDGMVNLFFYSEFNVRMPII